VQPNPGERAKTGSQEPTEDDIRNGGEGGNATDPVGLTDVDNYGGYGEDYSAAAQGGLVDLLHKMRSHK